MTQKYENKQVDFTLAILTPAYNRPHLLEKAYNSLVSQTCKDFVWYIVDDGSREPQSEIVEKFKAEKKIKINLIIKENGGKHTALNEGLKYITEPAVLILDNDDFLTIDAVEQIKRDWITINKRDDFCGLGYLKCDVSGSIVGRLYTKDGVENTFINERYNNNIFGDKCEVYKTEILKKYPFPVFSGERFLSESTVWCQISGPYKFKFFNKAIYACEYQAGGLSDNVQKTLFNNPKGATLCYKILSGKGFNFKNKVKYTVLYIVHAKADKRKFCQIIKESSNKFLTFLLMPLGFVIYLNRKKNAKK